MRGRLYAEGGGKHTQHFCKVESTSLQLFTYQMLHCRGRRDRGIPGRGARGVVDNIRRKKCLVWSRSQTTPLRGGLKAAAASNTRPAGRIETLVMAFGRARSGPKLSNFDNSRGGCPGRCGQDLLACAAAAEAPAPRLVLLARVLVLRMYIYREGFVAPNSLIGQHACD